MYSDTLLEQFVKCVEEQYNERMLRIFPDSLRQFVKTEKGYKFIKVYLAKSDGKPDPRYMVNRRTGEIYGVKSWTQINLRRQFGTLETATEYDWSELNARPVAGSTAELEHFKRETEIRATHLKRGRKTNSQRLAEAVK